MSYECSNPVFIQAYLQQRSLCFRIVFNKIMMVFNKGNLSFSVEIEPSKLEEMHSKRILFEN